MLLGAKYRLGYERNIIALATMPDNSLFMVGMLASCIRKKDYLCSKSP